MPFKDPEKSKEYFRQRYIKKLKANPNMNKESYAKLDKVKKSKEDKEYRQTHPQSHLQVSRNNWKKRGVLDNFNDNYKTLYRIYQSTKFCDDCGFELNTGNYSQRKCLDHCHETGHFRNIICHNCNIKRR